MIPEWLSFRNEFHSRMKFVVHPHHKIHWFGLFSFAWCLHHIRYACASYPRLHNLWFTHCLQSRMKFVFSLHDTRMKFHSRTRISFTQIENRNDLCGNQKAVFASRKKNTEKLSYDGVSSFQNESHSGIMWIVPCYLSRLFTVPFFSVRLWGSTFKCTISNLLWEEARTIFNKFY